MKYSILIVEDNSIVAEDIKQSLENLGYKVAGIAYSGKEAIKKAETTHPDIILMDIFLKGKMDGIETAENIRKSLNIPVVYLTSYANKQLIRKAKLTEPFGYIIKPFYEKELDSTIQIALYKYKMETRLSESEERYHSIFKFNPDYIFLCDTEGAFLDANPSFLNALGITLDSIKKNSILDFYDGHNVNKLMGHIKSLNKGKEIKGLHINFITSDDKTLFCEINAVPLEKKGKINELLFIARDITKQKKAEFEINKFKTIADEAGYGVKICDLNGHILYINDSYAKMCGYTVGELLNKNYSILFNEELKKSADELNDLLWQKGTCVGVELWHAKKDNTVFPCSVNGTLVKDKNNNPHFMAYTSVDITRRKRAEEEVKKHQILLENSEKELKEFSHRILTIREEEKKKLSTNLHNELGSIAVIFNLNLSKIEKEIKNNNLASALESISESKKIFRDAITRLKKITRDLRPPDLEIIGLPDALREYLSKINEQTNINVRFQANLDHKKISDNISIILYRVVQEAVTNIIKHADADKADIILYSRDGEIELNIKDNGKSFDKNKKFGYPNKHFGVRGMKEMVESIGGTFDIKTSKEKGTEVKVKIEGK